MKFILNPALVLGFLFTASNVFAASTDRNGIQIVNFANKLAKASTSNTNILVKLDLKHANGESFEVDKAETYLYLRADLTGAFEKMKLYETSPQEKNLIHKAIEDSLYFRVQEGKLIKVCNSYVVVNALEDKLIINEVFCWSNFMDIEHIYEGDSPVFKITGILQPGTDKRPLITSAEVTSLISTAKGSMVWNIDPNSSEVLPQLLNRALTIETILMAGVENYLARIPTLKHMAEATGIAEDLDDEEGSNFFEDIKKPVK